VNSRQVELRCYEVAQERFIFGNRYTLGSYQGALLDVADKFCADLLEEVIGSGAFFRSRLAFVKSDGRLKSDIWSMLPNCRFLNRLTNMSGYALSPTWSPDGGKVLFSQIDKRSHALGVYDFAAKRARRIKFPGNTVIGPCYLPGGGVAVSLTDGRYPSIFQLNGNFQKQYRLEDSQAIDVSPSVDAAGRYMAFTSSRSGGPQIYLKDLMSGSVRRVSQAGNYNSDPSISPDGSMVAYARQDVGGHRIFVQDLITGQERQISFGPGSDEEPAFAPDNYFIVFMSTRSGQREIYITTRNGGEPKRLPTGSGDAAFPAWGPATK
jgi:TolB protein